MSPDLRFEILLVVFGVVLIYAFWISVYCNRLRFKMAKIMELTAVQGAKGNWNYDPYMLGMYNGLSLAESIMFSRDYEPRQHPEEWVNDREQLDKDIREAVDLYLTKKINIEELSIKLVEAEARHVEKENNRRKATSESGRSGGGEAGQGEASRVDVKYPEAPDQPES